jgi:tyrosyl-tRNA synthetase
LTRAELFFHRSHESLEGASAEDFMALVTAKTEHAIGLDEITKRVRDGEKLKVKFGADPTGPDLHLGHIVSVRVLDLFSRAGHHIDLLFGDFTAKIGDPTERVSDRPLLTEQEIASNMTTFQDQVDRFFDSRRANVTVHNNSEWLGSMSLTEVFGYLQAINLTEATQRNDFRDRIRRGMAVTLAETVYGTLMGIDSVYLGSEVEIGGIDQLLNFQQCRAVQRSRGQRPEDVVMTPLLEGIAGDGRKMSKSLGNFVPARAEPRELFGKIMSIPDRLIAPYLKAFAPIYLSEVPDLDAAADREPFELKKQLAGYLVALSTNSLSMAEEAREDFERRFSAGEIREDDAVRLVAVGRSVIDTLLTSGDFKSRSELRRLAEQGGIKIDGQTASVEDLTGVTDAALVTIGRRRVYSITKE